MINIKKLLTTGVAIAALSYSPSASSDSFNLTGSITLVEVLSLAETQNLDFGTIIRDVSAGTVTTKLNTSGSIVFDGDTTAVYLDQSAVHEGAYTITGAASIANGINLSATDAADGDGMVFTSIFASYGGLGQEHDIMATPLTGLALPGAGTALALGGILEVDPTIVTEGNKIAHFILDVNYE